MVRQVNTRDDTWLQEFEVSHLHPTIKERLYNILREYADLFLGEGDILTCANEVKHGFTLESGAQPICKAPYRIPYH